MKYFNSNLYRDIFNQFLFLLFADFPDIQSDQRRLEHVEALTGVLRSLLDPNMMPNATDFLAIYGRVNDSTINLPLVFDILLFSLQMIVNAFNILDQEMNSIATGIYLGVSITDHSCVPNAVATFNGTTLFIRTIQDLPSIEWSKVTFMHSSPHAVSGNRS